MKILGLITEYNPFHNGHKYHIEQSKLHTNSTHTVAVMSGNFVQRGEPAIIDKWTRSEIAIKNGVDLVIELPTLFAISSAEFFSFGAVKVLDSLGIVDTICFGSESGSIDYFKKISDLVVDKREEIDNLIEEEKTNGLSYPAARSLAINKLLDSEECSDFNLPNDILGIEYLKSLKILNSNIEPATIKRISSDYNSEILTGYISSATSIRKHLIDVNGFSEDLSNSVPKETFEFLQNKELIFYNNLEDLILYKIRTSSNKYLNTIHDISEGLENRIIAAANKSSTIDELLDNIKSKRYTLTRIKRVLIKILLDVTSDYIMSDYKTSPKYIRVLAFNTKGRELLSMMKKSSTLPVITNLSKFSSEDEETLKQLALDVKATDIYALLHKNHKSRSGGNDFLTSPVIINE